MTKQQIEEVKGFNLDLIALATQLDQANRLKNAQFGWKTKREAGFAYVLIEFSFDDPLKKQQVYVKDEAGNVINDKNGKPLKEYKWDRVTLFKKEYLIDPGIVDEYGKITVPYKHIFELAGYEQVEKDLLTLVNNVVGYFNLPSVDKLNQQLAVKN